MHQLAADWRGAELTPANAALCAFAEKLTLQPAGVAASQVAGYFTYFNRVAGALHVEQESFVRAWEQPPDAS